MARSSTVEIDMHVQARIGGGARTRSEIHCLQWKLSDGTFSVAGAVCSSEIALGLITLGSGRQGNIQCLCAACHHVK